MKLLLDQNLSPRIAAILADDFPGSHHIAELGLAAAPDLDVWNYAKANGFCIASKDSDFSDWAQVFGFPPAVVWLRVGNCSTSDIFGSPPFRVGNTHITKVRQDAVLG